MIRAAFEGTLLSLMNAISRIVPRAPAGGGVRWQDPRILWGRADSLVSGLIFDDGIDLGPERKAGLVKEVSPGNCVVMLESPCIAGRRRRVSPAGFGGGRGQMGSSPSEEWAFELLRDISAAGGLAVTMGNTWEAWEGGVSGVIAEALGRSLPVSRTYPVGGFLREKAYKIVVFVPRGHEDAVRDAMARRGAGHIGNYSHCTFQAPGQGTFLPLQGSHPYIGTRGNLERVEEVRLETLVRERSLEPVIEAMLEVHPYEEVAYDVFELQNAALLLGASIAVDFEKPVTPEEIFRAVSEPGAGGEGARMPAAGQALTRLVISRFCGEEEVDAARRCGAGALIYVEETYPGRVWSSRLNVPAIRAGLSVYDEVLKKLASSVSDVSVAGVSRKDHRAKHGEFGN